MKFFLYVKLDREIFENMQVSDVVTTVNSNIYIKAECKCKTKFKDLVDPKIEFCDRCSKLFKLEPVATMKLYCRREF